jgi:hypothetical protein
MFGGKQTIATRRIHRKRGQSVDVISQGLPSSSLARRTGERGGSPERPTPRRVTNAIAGPLIRS